MNDDEEEPQIEGWSMSDLSGEWVSAEKAFTIARRVVDRHGGSTIPLGALVLERAALGVLPTATNRHTHTVPIDSPDAKRAATHNDDEPYRMLNPRFWDPFVIGANPPYEIWYASQDWESGFFSASLGRLGVKPGRDISEWFNAQPIYFTYVKNVIFYKPALAFIWSPAESISEVERYPWERMTPIPPTMGAPNDPPTPIGGRPPLPVWQDVMMQLAAHVVDEGRFASQGEAIRFIYRYCDERGIARPSESSAKERVRTFWRTMGWRDC